MNTTGTCLLQHNYHTSTGDVGKLLAGAATDNLTWDVAGKQIHLAVR